MGLQLAEVVHPRLEGLDPGGALAFGEISQRPQRSLVRGDDEPALGLVLDLLREDRGEFAPQAGRQQGQVELRARLLVGDEQVAFPGTRRAARDGAAVHDGHGESGAGRVVRDRGSDDAGADDHDVQGMSLGHGSNMSHSLVGA